MLSSVPVKLDRLTKKTLDSELVRIGMIAELDAVNLYEQLAATTDNEDLKRVFMDIAREEKTHFGEFQALLLKLDEDQAEELKKGREEVEELTGE
ncbi:rubrerythrin [Candidatus Bathyarchaeota archaeon]|nr:rubrerythrin [Candidatus Bathyarchaeota archaeon]